MGRTLKQIDYLEIARILRSKGTLVLTSVGKAAFAMNPVDVVIQGVTFMPQNGSCLYNVATDTVEGNNKFTMAAYNYMELDKETCKPAVEVNTQFINFLKLDPVSRLKMARYNPKLCSLIYDLAKKQFIANDYQIKCDGSMGGFTMIEPSNSNVNSKVAREMASAKLNDQEQAAYLKLNKQINFNHVVSVKNETYSVEYPNTTQPLQSCKTFTVNAEKGTTSENRGVCKTLTSKVTENMYEYAQISKCCTGDTASYCDAFKKSFIASDNETRSTGNSNTNGVRTRK